jgi:hypothetical protein
MTKARAVNHVYDAEMKFHILLIYAVDRRSQISL